MHLEIQQILAQVIAFMIMVWVLNRYAWKPLLRLLEERRDKIYTEFQSIDDQKKEIKKLTEEYNIKLKGIEAEARQKIQEEISKGREIAEKIQKEAHTQAQGILTKAQSDVEREIAKAKIQLKNDLVDLVITSTQKVIQEKMQDKDKQKALIGEFIEQVEVK